MFIWVAVNIEDQLVEFKDALTCVRQRVGARDPSMTLPLHVSLKISFEVKDSLLDRAISVITKYYSSLAPFSIQPEQIEQNGSIVWLKMADNGTLAHIHRDLTELAQNEFHAEPHEYDRDFTFHTTLFFGNDDTEAAEFYEAAKDLCLPEALTAHRFIIGISPSGQPGTYRVFREINHHQGGHQ